MLCFQEEDCLLIPQECKLVFGFIQGDKSWADSSVLIQNYSGLQKWKVRRNLARVTNRLIKQQRILCHQSKVFYMGERSLTASAGGGPDWAVLRRERHFPVHTWISRNTYMLLGSGQKPKEGSGACRKGTESKVAFGCSCAVPTLYVLPRVPPRLMSVAGKVAWELELEEARGEKVNGTKET